MLHFEHTELLRLVRLALSAIGPNYAAVRHSYFEPRPEILNDMSPGAPSVRHLIFGDLTFLNRAPAIDDTAPMCTWLRNADFLNPERGFEPYCATACDSAQHLPPLGQPGAEAGNGDGPTDPRLQASDATAVYAAAQDATGLPLLGRDDLRDNLRYLAESQRRVLSVRGEPNAGKSYSHYFAHLIALALGRRTVLIDVRLENVEAFKPLDLALKLALPLGIQATPPEQHAQDTAYANTLANWLVRAAGDANVDLDNTWLVLDHFTDPNVHEDTRVMVDQLAQSASNRAFPVTILLGHEQPSEVRPLGQLALREDIVPLASDDVASYYRRLLTVDGVEPEADVVAQLVTAVMDDLPAGSGAAELHQAVQAVNEVVFTEPGGTD